MDEQIVPINEKWAITLKDNKPNEGVLLERGIRTTLDPLHKALLDKLITTNNLLTQLIHERAS